MNDKLQSTIEPNCLPTISHFSLSQLVIMSLVIFGNIGISMNINLKCMHFVHQCCCLELIYKPKGARTATRQRRWQRMEKIMVSPRVKYVRVFVGTRRQEILLLLLLQEVEDDEDFLDEKQEVENGPENEKMNIIRKK